MKQIVSLEPAPNGGEVSSALCLPCKRMMVRSEPVAVVFHARVAPTLHTQFLCPSCESTVIIEEDALDLGFIPVEAE